MNPLILTLIKLFASSVMLYGFYLILFKNKSTFLSRRLFLLAIPVLSLVFSMVSIQTDKGIVRFSLSALLEGKNIINSMETVNYTDFKNTDLPPVVWQESNNTQINYVKGEAIYGNDKSGDLFYSIIASVYSFVLIVFLFITFRQLIKIRKIRSNTNLQYIDGIPVYISNEIKSSFSILRNIYIRSDAQGEKLGLIVRHEQQHILCRHYIDLALFEFMTILMWFNPLMWFIRKELRVVHEFEADAKLLNNGVKVREYMMAILEEVTGTTPLLANGLQGSLIKKRFMNMKNENRIRLKSLRLVLTVPFLALLLFFFSCRNSSKVYEFNTLYQQMTENVKTGMVDPQGRLLYEVRNCNGEIELLWEDELTEKLKEITTFRINGLAPVRVINVNLDGSYIRDVSDEFPLKENDQEEGIDLAYHNATLASDGSWINPDGKVLEGWTRSYMVRYNAKAITNKKIYINDGYKEANRIIRIVANDKETRITFATTSYWDWCWRFTDKNTCLIDKATGDRYMIRDIEGDEEVGRLSILEGTNGKWFENTKIFPPLKKGVTVVDYYSPFNNIDAPVEYNGTETRIPDIQINNWSGEVIR